MDVRRAGDRRRVAQLGRDLGDRPRDRLLVVLGEGPGFARPVFDAPPNGTGGRGLYLVDALADRWGAEPSPQRDGWLVWFELDL